MTLTEAAACGTPAVATRIAGHADAVRDGRSGLLADDDPAASATPSPGCSADRGAPGPARRGALSLGGRAHLEQHGDRLMRVVADEVARRRSRR